MVAERQPMRIHTALFLDVATKYTGYAMFQFEGKIQPGSFTLRQFGNIKANTSHDWRARCLEITMKAGKLFHEIQADTLVLEYPSFQGGVKGTAASRSGGTLELAYLCGRLDREWEERASQLFHETNGRVRLMLPIHMTFNEWNGQLTKDITCHRLHEYFGVEADPKTIENNYADAIMMGQSFFVSKINVGVTRGSVMANQEDI